MNLLLNKVSLITLTGILAAAITMMKQARFRPPLLHSHMPGPRDQISEQTVAHGQAHHLAREQIDNACHIQPTFAGGNIGDIGHPFLVGCARAEVTRQGIGLNRSAVLTDVVVGNQRLGRLADTPSCRIRRDTRWRPIR